MRRWFERRPENPALPKRFAELKAMPPDRRRAALTSSEGSAWIEAAAKYGLVEAQVLWGQSLLQSNPHMAFRWLSGAAVTGYPPAVNMLGRCFEKGWGTQPDDTQAAECYRTAAEQGFGWAQYNLANMLLYGLGVPRDRGEAHRWYGLAAAQGHAKAMNMLGRSHEEGWSGPPDLIKAASWYRSAAAGGDYRGQFNFGTILAQNGRAREATAWFKAALSSGDADFLAQAYSALHDSAHPEHRELARVTTPRRRDMDDPACIMA